MGLPRPTPDADEAAADEARRTERLLILSLIGANLLGVFVIFVFAGWMLPLPEVDDPAAGRIINLIGCAVFFPAFTVVAIVWGRRRFEDAREFLRSDRDPTPSERMAVLRVPLQLALMHAFMWSVGAIAFGALNAAVSTELGQRVAITVALAGITTSAVAYLVAERELRPAAARALAAGVGGGTVTPGVKARAFLAWALGTGVPILGVILVGLSSLTAHDFTATELAVTVIALAAISLAAGLYVSMLAARAVADPIVSVREALAEVERGRLDVEVPVYDGSEVGLLQAGFNQMVEGLRERERIHDLFGRHVGEDVARAALEQEVELGGETREVSVLFVDLVGSTKLAAERPPGEVVDLLNRFFGVVVEVVRDHGGWVNKFEGDAALAIFGAPVPLPDHASRALAAARELRNRLAGLDDHPEEPVDEAARLTELAKNEGGVLASESALARASEEEAGRWELGRSVALRGRSRETRLAKPRL